MKKIYLFFAMLFLATLSYGQAMSGVYKVGATETAPNFASLKSACDALNTNGMSGDVIFEITSNLTETESSRIGVNTGTNSVTIRPSSDTDYRIELTKATDNARASGLIIIGLTGDSWENLTANTSNVTIDGYAVGGTTRRLTLATTDAANIFHGPIQIVGSGENIAVKNCILDQRNLVSGSTTYAVRLRVEQNAAATVFAPSNIVIENNIITAVKNGAQMGIGLTAASGITTYTLKGVVIKNNEISARTRAISMSNYENIQIEGNTIKTEQTNPGMLSTWVQGIANGVGTVDIKRNKFISALTANTSAGAYGIRGIIASGGGTWYIDNNYFTGFKVTGTTGSTEMTAIRCGNTCIIRNNTFYLNSLNSTGITVTYQAILIAAGTPTILNNILVSDEDAIPNTLLVGTIGGETDYNNYFLRTGTTNARISGSNTTLAAHQAANPGKDVNSKSVDVDFVDETTGNLNLMGSSDGDNNLAAPRLAEVTTDIMGTARKDPAYMGAFEAPTPIIVVAVDELSGNEITVLRTASGITVTFEGEGAIELYNMNGQLIDKANAYNSYSRDLERGAYIIRVNGKAVKFVR